MSHVIAIIPKEVVSDFINKTYKLELKVKSHNIIFEHQSNHLEVFKCNFINNYHFYN